MMLLFDSRFWLALAAAFTLTFLAGNWTGKRAANAKYALRLAQADTAAREQRDALSRKLLREVDNLMTRNQKEKDAIQAQNDQLRSALRNGSRRVSVSAGSCSTTRDPGTGATETRAELLPATATDIHDIGADADSTVRDLNTCIDAYNTVRQRSLQSQ